MTKINTNTRQKGYLQLAPSGERLIAAASVISWMVFVLKFAVI